MPTLYHEYPAGFKHKHEANGGMRMKGARVSAFVGIFKGLLLATVVTLVGMLLLAAAVVLLGMSDGVLSALNQVLKLASIVAGVRAAVGIGGSRGFATGAAVALLYMVIGYALYCTLGGMLFSWTAMLGEILIGAAVGAIAGTIFVNLHPKGKKRVRAA